MLLVVCFWLYAAAAAAAANIVLILRFLLNWPTVSEITPSLPDKKKKL